MEKNEKIIERESWFKILITVFLIGIIVWKLIDGTIKIQIIDFKFSELLSLILAFFAIGLSVSFYFKATETSNSFYDNTYKFTKEISEILGRMEAGFGERLRHLDESYSNIWDRFIKNTPSNNSEQAKKEIAEEEKQLEKINNERIVLIEELAKRAKMQEHEKESFLKQLHVKDEEMNNLRKELILLKRELSRNEDSRPYYIDDSRRKRFEVMRRHLIRTMIMSMDRDFWKEAPKEVIIRRINKMLKDMSPNLIDEMQEFGLVDNENDLTEKGLEFLNTLAISA